MLQSQKNRGFSLVELMVVIGIVGILISLLYVNFNSARENTRDKLRQTTLSDLQLAIERYKAQTGQYPVAGCSATASQWATAEQAGIGTLPGVYNCPAYISGLAPQFIPALPSPSTADGRGYYYQSDGNAYKLIIYQQIEGMAGRVDTFNERFAVCPAQCSDSSTPSSDLCHQSSPAFLSSYAVYSPGGACFK